MSANDFNWANEVDEAIASNESMQAIDDYIEAHVLLRVWLSRTMIVEVQA